MHILHQDISTYPNSLSTDCALEESPSTFANLNLLNFDDFFRAKNLLNPGANINQRGWHFYSTDKVISIGYNKIENVEHNSYTNFISSSFISAHQDEFNPIIWKFPVNHNIFSDFVIKESFSVNNGTIIIDLTVNSISKKLHEETLKNWGFELESSSEIINFLTENPEVKIPLAEAKEKVAEYFNDFVLKLFLYRDYEENYEVLNLVILNNLPAEEALKKEELLFEDWFEEHYINLNGKLTLRESPL